MIFGQLIEYNRRSLFLKKSFSKYTVETSRKPLFKKSKFDILLDPQSEVSYNLFILQVQVKDYQNMLKLRC